jgi:HSP20 family molecular chaperone IbpA
VVYAERNARRYLRGFNQTDGVADVVASVKLENGVLLLTPQKAG